MRDAAEGSWYWVIDPCGVILPICRVPSSVNHTFPSGPAAVPKGSLLACGSEYSLRLPPGLIRAMALLPASGNQSAPSAPRAMLCGALFPLGSATGAAAHGGPVPAPASTAFPGSAALLDPALRYDACTADDGGG